MDLNWSNTVIKYALFIFNLLFVISGIIMIAVGVSVKAYYTDYDIFLVEKYFSLPNLLIAIGSLIFFISFFGCCGAIRESWFMIFVFSVLLSLIFILEFSAGIAGYVLRDDTASYLTGELQKSMSQYVFGGKDISKTSYTYMWDRIQEEFKCCGAVGPDDWKLYHVITTTTTTSPPASSETTISSKGTVATTASSAPSTESTTETSKITPLKNRKRRWATPGDIRFSKSKLDLPASCCKPVSGASGVIVCSLNDTSTAEYYTRGCAAGFGEFLKEHAVTLAGMGMTIGLIQLFWVIFACHLTRKLKHRCYSA